MSNLALRFISALTAIPIVVGMIYLGGWYHVGLAVFVVAVAQYEFYGLPQGLMDVRHTVLGLVLGGLVVVAQYQVGWAFPVAGVLIVAMLMYDAFDIENERIWDQISWTVMGAVYPAFFFSFMVPLRFEWADTVTPLQHFFLPLALLMMVWASDTFAYTVGKLFGKHQMAPIISPHKTWEGAFGGFAGALATMSVLKITALPILSWPDVLVVSVIAGIGGQISDLTQSRLKRIYGVKDAGRFMLGHGGLLDRIDGIILVVPIYYIYLTFVL